MVDLHNYIRSVYGIVGDYGLNNAIDNASQLFCMKKFLPALLAFLMVKQSAFPQDISAVITDKHPIGSEPGIEHADPVFNDFITDLGAKRGTGQINFNFGYQNMVNNHHGLLSQLEFEYAPIDNLGFELLLPYNVYFNNDLSLVERPENKLEFLQWSAQFTFLTSYSNKISMAIGFTNSFEMESPERKLNQNKGVDLKTVLYHPFLTFAKNWSNRYFLTFSGGPDIAQELEPKEWGIGARLNTSFHYGFSEQDHYLGLELNKEILEGSLEMFIRPQVTLQLGEKLKLGAAVGLPAWIEDSSWSAFIRLAYELD